MADLNALIAQGYQFQPPPDPFAQYAKQQQLQQGEQANQLNQMKMQEYQRGMEETNALRRLDPTSATYLEKIKRINPKMGFEFAKLQQEAKTAGTEGEIKNTKLISDKLALLPEAYRMADTPEAYLQLHQSVHADPVLGPYLKSVGATPEKGLAAIQNAVQTGKFNELRMGSMQSLSQLLDSMKPLVVGASSSVYNPQTKTYTQAPAAPEKAAAPPAMVAEYTFAKTPDGGNFKGSYQDFVTARAAAGRAPAAPRPEAAPVAVVDPVTKKQIYVTREKSFGMTPASAMESLAPKEIQAREAKYPHATLAVETIESSSDRLASDLDELAQHPGLSGISGIIYGNTPAITKNARVALEKYKSILARGGFSELQSMRAASPTGGALGNVSNQENQYLRDAFAAIGRSQDTADLKTALESAANVARASKQRVRDAYDMTYDYKTSGGTSVDASNPLLK